MANTLTEHTRESNIEYLKLIKAAHYTKTESDENFYNKSYVDTKIYTKTEVDNNTYTKAQANNAFPLKTEVYTKTDVYTKTEIDTNIYTKTEIDTNIYTKVQVDTNTYTKAQVDAKEVKTFNSGLPVGEFLFTGSDGKVKSSNNFSINDDYVDSAIPLSIDIRPNVSNSIRTYIGAAQFSMNGGQTGAIRFDFPEITFHKNSMLQFTFQAYNYSGGAYGTSWKAEVQCYPYTNDVWYNYRVRLYGDAPFTKVRLGNIDGRKCIILGEIDTVWSYPSVVMDIRAGYANQDMWGSGWDSSLVVDISDITNIFTPHVIKINRNILEPLEVDNNGAATGLTNIQVRRFVNDGRQGYVSFYTFDGVRKAFIGYGGTDGLDTWIRLENGCANLRITGGGLISDGFTKLGGSSAPAIRVKKLSGVTADAEGGTTIVATGVTGAKILSVSILITTGSDTIPTNHDLDGYRVRYWIRGNDIHVRNHTVGEGGSANALSKNFRMTITYEQ